MNTIYRTILSKKKAIALAIGGVVASAAVAVGAYSIQPARPLFSLTAGRSPTANSQGVLPHARHRRCITCRAFHLQAEFYAPKKGVTETVTIDRGVLVSLSTTSISIKEPGQAALVNGSLTTSTKFLGLSLVELQADLSQNKAVRVRLLQRNGSLQSVRSRVGNSPTSKGTAASGLNVPLSA